MSYSKKTIPLSTASNYGTAMKQVVNIILSEFPEVTLRSVKKDSSSTFDVYLNVGSDGLVMNMYNSDSTIGNYLGSFQDGSFVSIGSSSNIYVNYYDSNRPRYITIHSFNNGAFKVMELVTAYTSSDTRRFYFHVMSLFNPYDGKTYFCSS